MTYLIILIYIFFSFNSYATQNNSSLDVAEKIEKNLIYSKEIQKQSQASDVVIKKGGWTQDDIKEIETRALQEKKITSEVKSTKQDNTSAALKRKAFDAMNVGQYEIAILLYKDAIKINKNDVYAKLGLATAYQYLGQYIQAKPLYLDVLEAFPTDQQVMANLLAIITDETPYEAVYLLSNIADKNLHSPLLQAQTSIAYTKVKNYNKAIEYIQRAIELDKNNLEYRYNLAVLYDLNQNYSHARNLYSDLLSYVAANPDSKYNLPLKDIQDRINTLKNTKK